MAGHTRAEVEIAAPREFVYGRTNDLDRWTEMFTEYETVEVLERGPRHFVFRLTTKPDEEGKVYSWVSRRDLYPEEWRIHAYRVEAAFPFARMDIHWSYEEHDGATLMRWEQDFDVSPEAPFSERDAEEHITAGSSEQMAAIRAYIENAWNDQRAGAGAPRDASSVPATDPR